MSDNTFPVQTNGIYALIDNGENVSVKINELCVKIVRVFVREKNIQCKKFIKMPVKKKF